MLLKYRKLETPQETMETVYQDDTKWKLSFFFRPGMNFKVRGAFVAAR
jgi:hypothetical protein